MPARSLRLTSALLVAAVGLSACGNYSTEDLRFLAALPQRDELAFKVPAPAAQQALSACPSGDATVWLNAKPVSDSINASVDFLLGLVDHVRRVPPTWRTEDGRGWGPFDDEKHPDREIQVVIARTWPAELGGDPRYGYAFQARPKGTASFTTILWGIFDGGSASRGKGYLELDFEAIHALGMQDATTPHGKMQVAYDRTADPVKLQLVLTNDAFGAVQFGYRSARWAAGEGVFDFAFRDASANLLVVSTQYDAQTAGHLTVAFQGAGGATGSYDQCWGAGACLVYVGDPGNYSCATPPCSFGDAAVDCPKPLPVSPF